MSDSDSRRIPANQVGLFLVVLLAVWLAFSYFSWDPKPTPAAVVIPVVESKLHAVGLQDNPDWEGLPELFAIWADHVQWMDDKARFAYWNPGSKTYSYYFEVTKLDGVCHFRAMSSVEASREILQYVDEDFSDALDAAEHSVESPTHPFVFLYRVPMMLTYRPSPPQIIENLGDHRIIVPVDLKPVPLTLPPVKRERP